MKILCNSIGLCSGLALMLSPALAADRALLDPDWNDPGVAKARSALESARAARPSADANRDANIPLSLPRWGLGNRMDRPTPDEQSRARAALPSGNVPAWPSCAKATADPKPLTDKSGLWYTDTYDYGCVVISISGDRAANPDQSFPAGISLPDECSDPNAVDSTETDTRGRFELQLSLNRIPYTIEGQCSEEAELFCRTRAGRCALVGRLILRGGSPQ
jgi:hypothetical protein